MTIEMFNLFCFFVYVAHLIKDLNQLKSFKYL